MRLEQYINDPFEMFEIYELFANELNEGVSDDTFERLQALGQKMGIKVRRSKTFQDQLKKAGKGLKELMKLVLDYSLHADILDSKARIKLESNIKQQFSKVDKQDVISFIVNIDKTFLGLTSIPRHILQNVLGITIATYDNWQSNQNYIKSNMEKIIAVLSDMGDKEDIILAKRIYKNVTGEDFSV